MRISWLTGLALLYLGGMLISLTLEGQYIGADEANVFHGLLNPEFGSFTNPISAIGGFFIAVWGFIQALWAMFTWNYSFLDGPMEIFRYVGWAASIGMIVSLVLAVRGTGSS